MAALDQSRISRRDMLFFKELKLAPGRLRKEISKSDLMKISSKMHLKEICIAVGNDMPEHACGEWIESNATYLLLVLAFLKRKKRDKARIVCEIFIESSAIGT